MNRVWARKAALLVASAAIYIAIPAATAKADTIPTEQGVAGFAYLLDNYYSCSEGDKVAADEAILNVLKTEIISPYANLGVSIADNYVNVRKEPSTDSEVVGKLYRGCAADILERLEGDWVKIQSGDVKGYIASNFLAIGKDAESMVDEYATQYATVNTQTLRVREDTSVDSKILTLIPGGETYPVKKVVGDWVEIVLGTDEDTGGDFTGFVSKEFVEIKVEFKFAISVEEEQRILREQQEAERAERERKEKLAQEKAEREEAARRQREEQKKASSSQQVEKPSTPSGSGSALRNDIITYAKKFVGNRYVWGGVSLTRGADCSGFVQAVYADFGYSIPRTSREQAAGAGKRVSESEMAPGDLVFYTNSRGVVNHVAMYIGDGKIVHAANSRQGIIISNVRYRDIYCVRRVVN
jgi:cell wall-associated NlpC family hydrolase